MNPPGITAVLLLSCPDRAGLVARIAQFIYERGGNILDLDEHVDVRDHHFFLRVSWSLDRFSIPAAGLEEAFAPLALEFSAVWKISLSGRRDRVAIFVSKYDHCLRELLWRHSLGEFEIDISLIISNHSDMAPLAAHHGIPFHVIPVTPGEKAEAERLQIGLCEAAGIDTIVLARYMQVLSPQFTLRYPSRIINIHHSFLPAFVGGNPYRQAYERGVKIIGATSHYVTDELDEGPIIEQDIIRITHRDTLEDLVRRGRDLERMVLSRALGLHCEHRILVNGRKTVIFG
ncbi:MAG: formyltetrahydrofolate deformylase [Chlorobiaceae bacterium]|nr:formyltetrahydrofolate deformylase [Chlorobiaceae bacterium]NTW73390.1 formyltetrahydrofolate deformylase [Chlorobiaceae bacterium]